MTWDGHKIDNTPSDQVNGHLNASDWNDLVSYVKETATDVVNLSSEVATYSLEFATINTQITTINNNISSIFASITPGYRGYYATSGTLPTIATSGDFSIVGSTDTIWIYDTAQALWINSNQSPDASKALYKDGTNSPIANIDFASYKITNIGNPTAFNDVTSKIYVDNEILKIPWKKTVIDIISYFPTIGTSGYRYALTNGSIIQYDTEWSTISPAYNGNTIYSETASCPYYWDTTTWKKFASSSDDTGVLLANGSVPLTNDWKVNATGYTHKITGLGDGSYPTDASTIQNVNKIRISMVCEPVDAIETVLNPITDLSSKANGYRYIRLVDLKLCEKYNNTWITQDPATGHFIADKSTGYYYRFNGSLWERFEYALDATKFDFSGLTLPHSQITNSNIANYHPMYLKVDGTVAMTTTSMNLSASGTAYRIGGVSPGVADTDVPNMKQLNLVASGYYDIDACSGIYNDPPTGSTVPRVIIGGEPSGVFLSYPSYVATYSLITETWSYEFPSKGWRTLLTDVGEYYNGEYLNEANTKWVYNGQKWVLDLGAVFHDSLSDTANSTKHTRYLRNDAAGNALGLITFKPSSQTVPFIVDSDHQSTVINLNSDLLDGFQTATFDFNKSYPSTIPVRDENGRIVSSYIEGGKITAINGLAASRTAASLYIDSNKQTVVTTSQGNGIINFIGYDEIEKDGIPFININSSIWASYVSKEEFPIDFTGKQVNYVVTYDGANFICKNPQDISGTKHSALRELHYFEGTSTETDDHEQYLNILRHDIIGRHTLGSVVPHDALTNLIDTEFTGLSTNQVVLWDGSKFVNAYVSAAIYNHDDLTNVAPSTKHRQFPLLSGSRMFYGNVSICNSNSYTDPTSGETVSVDTQSWLNRTLSMGLFSGKLQFEDYPYYNEWGVYAGSTHGVYLGHGGQSIHYGMSANTGVTNFTVTTTDGTLLNIVHGNGTTGSTTFTVDGWNVYSQGSARISGTYPTLDPSVGGAIVGLNAQYIQGKTLDDIQIGGSIDHGVLRNLHYLEGTSTEADHHPQYFNGTRHNTTSAHTLGSIVPHDSLGNLTNVSLGTLNINDLLIWNGTNFTNGPIGTTVNHDDTSSASSSTIHSKYIRNDITQTLTTAHLDFANAISSNDNIVPFTLNSAIAWSGPIKYLDAEKINGLTSDDLVKLAESNTFSATNTFASYSNFNSILRIPESSMLPWYGSTHADNREIYISTSSGFVQYRYNDTTYTLATRDGSIEGTTEQCFKINLNGSGGGIRLCDINATGVKVSNNIGELKTVYCSDVTLGSSESSLLTLLSNKIETSLIGVANGVAELDENGKIPISELPSYVSDIIESYVVGSTAFATDWLSKTNDGPALTPESNKIYVIVSAGDYQNKTYRWSGSLYVEISQSLALGETSSTAYRGDRGKIAYDHSQLTSGNPHNVTSTDVGLGNVTDDAQLKRSAADIYSFDTKASPTYTDWLLIEDSTDSYNKKKVQIQTLPLSGGAISDAPSDGTSYVRNSSSWIHFPTATTSSVGGIKIGSGLSITSDGTVSTNLLFPRERFVEGNLSTTLVIMPIVISQSCFLSEFSVGIQTLPTGADVLIDVRKNDPDTSSSSIFTNQVELKIKRSVATTYRTRSSNVATLTVASHSFATGDSVVISGVSGTGYNGTFTITAVSTTTISYANTGSDESSTADTGGTIAIQKTNGLYQTKTGDTNQTTIDDSITLVANDTIWILVTQVGSTIVGAGLSMYISFGAL